MLPKGKHDFQRVQFVGCPYTFVPPDQQDAVIEVLRPLDCTPVFLQPEVASAYYQGYCMGVLWPLFHNILDVYNPADTLEPFVEGHRTSISGTSDSTKDEDAREWAAPHSWNPRHQSVFFFSISRSMPTANAEGPCRSEGA